MLAKTYLLFIIVCIYDKCELFTNLEGKKCLTSKKKKYNYKLEFISKTLKKFLCLTSAFFSCEMQNTVFYKEQYLNRKKIFLKFTINLLFCKIFKSFFQKK